MVSLGHNELINMATTISNTALIQPGHITLHDLPCVVLARGVARLDLALRPFRDSSSSE